MAVKGVEEVGTMRQSSARAEEQIRTRSTDPPVDELKGSARLGSYLKNLRQGYGYSLRKVEEKARSLGGEIDNSQLSRYEKGVCYPSFDKLRTLARVYNVSVQTFSDVVDLEQLEHVDTESVTPQDLMERAQEEFTLGDYDRAYALYRAAEGRLLQQGDPEAEPELAGSVAKTRLAKAVVLYRLGKISLAEQETRQLLRLERHLDQPLLVRALLQLSNVHTSFGELMLADMEAHRALEIARGEEALQLQAYAHHALGRIHQERHATEEALEHYHEALRLYRDAGDDHEALKVKLNLGPLYAARGQFREGVRLLRDVRNEARGKGHRWTVASACAWLAEVHFRRGDHDTARKYMRESNAIASSGEAQYVDILFLNAYYLWKIADAEANATEAKIAIGRMKYLRPYVEQNLAEVRDFDRFMEGGAGS
jgi:tetratricopeptide (TPR) repeat protein